MARANVFSSRQVDSRSRETTEDRASGKQKRFQRRPVALGGSGRSLGGVDSTIFVFEVGIGLPQNHQVGRIRPAWIPPVLRAPFFGSRRNNKKWQNWQLTLASSLTQHRHAEPCLHVSVHARIPAEALANHAAMQGASVHMQAVQTRLQLCRICKTYLFARPPEVERWTSYRLRAATAAP